jgi:hypothetical protein
MREEPRVTLVHTNDTDLAVHDWGGDGPNVMLVHATGLARTWDPSSPRCRRTGTSGNRPA